MNSYERYNLASVSFAALTVTSSRQYDFATEQLFHQEI